MNHLSKPDGESPCDVDLSGVSLVVRKTVSVRTLPGFSKSKHRLPDAIDRKSQEFVARLGTQLIRDDLDQLFAVLRSAFGFKRRDLEVVESDEGFGTIATPDFLYTSSVFQSEREPTDAVWQRDLGRIESPEILLDEACNSAFGHLFDAVEFVPPKEIDLERLIDHIEDVNDQRFSADYDRQITFCTIAIDDSPVSVQVTRGAFQIVHPGPTSPRQLIASVRDIQANLVDFTKLT